MVYATHISFANAIGLVPVIVLACNDMVLKRELIAAYAAALTIGAVIPDIDEPNSHIGKKFTGISEIVNHFFGHRGITHYFIVPAILFALLSIYTPKSPILFVSFFGFALGYFLHIIGDSMTVGGIPRAFYPISKQTFWLLPERFRFYTNQTAEFCIILPITSIVEFVEWYFIVQFYFI